VDEKKANKIIKKVKETVAKWRELAEKEGIAYLLVTIDEVAEKISFSATSTYTQVIG
jgi:hypothetical protein